MQKEVTCCDDIEKKDILNPQYWLAIRRRAWICWF